MYVYDGVRRVSGLRRELAVSVEDPTPIHSPPITLKKSRKLVQKGPKSDPIVFKIVCHHFMPKWGCPQRKSVRWGILSVHLVWNEPYMKLFSSCTKYKPESTNSSYVDWLTKYCHSGKFCNKSDTFGGLLLLVETRLFL